MVLNAMVWGEAIADVVMGVSKDLKYVVYDLVPLNMAFVNKKRQQEPKPDTDITAYMVKYGKQVLDTSRLVNMVLYTQGGAPYPFGMKVSSEVQKIKELQETWYFSTSQSALGNYIARSLDPSKPFPADIAKQFLQEMDVRLRTCSVLDNTEIVKLESEDRGQTAGAFDMLLREQEGRILKAYLMQWMSTAETNTGTYGSMQAWLDAYSRFVQAIADVVMALFEELAKREAKANGLPNYCKFVNDPLEIGVVDTTQEDVLTLYTAGIITVDEAREKLGLPVTTPPEPVVTPGQTASKAVDSWLSTIKKEAVRKEIARAILRKQQGQGSQFNFTQIDRMIKSTNLDKQTAETLIMGLETQLREIIKGNREPEEFDSIWQGFENEVKNAIQ